VPGGAVAVGEEAEEEEEHVKDGSAPF